MTKMNGVRQMAQGRWRSILIALRVDENALSGKHGPCPLCGGKDRFRFDDREGRGTYICSGCGAGDGMQLALDFTGLSFKELAQKIERLAGEVTPVASRPDRSGADRDKTLRWVWKAATPIRREDEAARYLLGRGLTLPTLPMSIRLHTGLPYHDEDHHLVGTFPAMLAAVTGPTGQVVTLHRTYLDHAQKAPVLCPKKLMPGLPMAGAAIRLFPISQSLGIAEGIETALAAAEMFGMPVWACASANGIESFVPPADVKSITVFADHDLNFTGQSAAYRAAHRLARQGYTVKVEIPTVAGDWLDILHKQSVNTRGVQA